MQNDLCPEALNTYPLLSPTVGNNTNYNFRNSTNIQTIRSNTQLYCKSFLLSVIRDWDDLPQDIQSSNSLSTFKRKLNADLNKPPTYYSKGKPLGQMYLARLRTQGSSLNHHFYIKDIVTGHLYDCGAVETMGRYLLECTRFDSLQQTMLNKSTHLSPQSLNTPLFGNQELSDAINKQIIDIVHDYILKTKQFQVQ